MAFFNANLPALHACALRDEYSLANMRWCIAHHAEAEPEFLNFQGGPGIDSKEPIPPGGIALRADASTTLFLLDS